MKYKIFDRNFVSNIKWNTFSEKILQKLIARKENRATHVSQPELLPEMERVPKSITHNNNHNKTLRSIFYLQNPKPIVVCISKTIISQQLLWAEIKWSKEHIFVLNFCCLLRSEMIEILVKKIHWFLTLIDVLV